MQLKKRIVLLTAAVLFVLLLIPTYLKVQNLLADYFQLKTPSRLRSLTTKELITFIIRYQNDVESLQYVLPKKQLFNSTIIIVNHFLKFHQSNRSIKYAHLNLDLLSKNDVLQPLNEVSTQFVLLSPVAIDHIKENELMELVQTNRRLPGHILAIPVKAPTPITCLSLRIESREWTVKYNTIQENICGAVSGNVALFANTNVLRKLPDPWLEIFPDALFIQSANLGINVKLVTDITFTSSKTIELDVPRGDLKYLMFEKLKIKKVEVGHRTEWYGCTRNTSRCFGTVHNDTPSFLLQGRWTPPCCLRVLRETARYAFRVFENHKLRYWLEGGSLLGAMRSGDIIPWDYDVDVGVYREDLLRCPWIRELHRQIDRGVKDPQVVDKNGYVWETSKADEGKFYRIQASKMNRMHVDIFPFYSINGIMTKETWMNHRQDREFSESFLKPLTKILFIGMKVSAPNNIRDFLEYKFGKGCIEKPEYPNPAVISYPKDKIPISIEPTED